MTDGQHINYCERAVTKCTFCPLWNEDRSYCKHPDCIKIEGKKLEIDDDYFAQCPLKKEPLTIYLINHAYQEN